MSPADGLSEGEEGAMLDMRRRAFIALLGVALAASPLTARAQSSGMPVIGYLGAESPSSFASRVKAFQRGLDRKSVV